MVVSPTKPECMGPRHQGSGPGSGSSVITINPLARFLLSIFKTFSSLDLEFWFSKRSNASTRGHSNDSVELEDEAAMWPAESHMLLNQLNPICHWTSEQKKRLLDWLEWLISITKRELGCCYIPDTKRTMSGTQGIVLGNLLVLLCPRVMENCSKKWKGRIIENSDPLRMKIGSLHKANNPNPLSLCWGQGKYKMCYKRRKLSMPIAASWTNLESRYIVVFYIFSLLFIHMWSFVYAAILFFLFLIILFYIQIVGD